MRTATPPESRPSSSTLSPTTLSTAPSVESLSITTHIGSWLVVIVHAGSDERRSVMHHGAACTSAALKSSSATSSITMHCVVRSFALKKSRSCAAVDSTSGPPPMPQPHGSVVVPATNVSHWMEEMDKPVRRDTSPHALHASRAASRTPGAAATPNSGNSAPQSIVPFTPPSSTMFSLGAGVGVLVGVMLGAAVGVAVGAADGAADGEVVGAAVGTKPPTHGTNRAVSALTVPSGVLGDPELNSRHASWGTSLAPNGSVMTAVASSRARPRTAMRSAPAPTSSAPSTVTPAAVAVCSAAPVVSVSLSVTAPSKKSASAAPPRDSKRPIAMCESSSALAISVWRACADERRALAVAICAPPNEHHTMRSMPAAPGSPSATPVRAPSVFCVSVPTLSVALSATTRT
mmetsp:Transcript_10517/g.25248  ORF Transcript_10517/g.25248 Transcript_10517/m.25248 type:complete len:404 (+) Transcript_10517:515-1726(+)